jgi:hypothetical protein
MKTLTPWMAAAALIGTLSLTACGGGGGDSGPQTGSLSIAVTDTPLDTNVTQVNIKFRGLRLKPKSGPAFDIDFGEGNEKTIDLLQLQGTNSADLIVDELVPAGEYNWVWLLVHAEKDVWDSTVQIDGSDLHPLYVPSSSQTGLKLVSGFVVPVGGDVDFIIDWNLANAVHAPSGQDPNYFIRPALRITNRAEVGTIMGAVDAGKIDENNPDNCEGGNRVYLFKKPDGADTLEDDMDELLDDGRADVLTTALVTYDVNDNAWKFVIGFVSPGNYTVAFTCSSLADDSMLDDYPDNAVSNFDFASRADLTVETGTTTDVTL